MYSKNKAFTLTEILIVLGIIGVITAIVTPIAFDSMPNENVIKFKKANALLGQVISDLISRDEYHLNGDLGIKPDGTLIDGTHEGDITYFCNSFANLLSTKSVNCSTDNSVSSSANGMDLRNEYNGWGYTIAAGKTVMDDICKTVAANIGSEIITADNITFYQTAPNYTFGYNSSTGTIPYGATGRYYGTKLTDDVTTSAAYRDANNLGQMYKMFCIDVDGINNGEDPFGYGIRADGTIVPGARADEWLEKEVTDD